MSADLVQIRDEHPQRRCSCSFIGFAGHALFGGVRAADVGAPGDLQLLLFAVPVSSFKIIAPLITSP